MKTKPEIIPYTDAQRDIVAIFEEIANFLEIPGANPFRIRAYRVAARQSGGLPQDVYSLVEKDADLTRQPGIGDDLSAKIREIVSSGYYSLLQRLQKELPPAIAELLKIPVIGPEAVKNALSRSRCQTVEQLYRAAGDGRIRVLPGFGDRHILSGTHIDMRQHRRGTRLITGTWQVQYKKRCLSHIIYI